MNERVKNVLKDTGLGSLQVVGSYPDVRELSYVMDARNYEKIGKAAADPVIMKVLKRGKWSPSRWPKAAASPHNYFEAAIKNTGLKPTGAIPQVVDNFSDQMNYVKRFTRNGKVLSARNAGALIAKDTVRQITRHGGMGGKFMGPMAFVVSASTELGAGSSVPKSLIKATAKGAVAKYGWGFSVGLGAKAALALGGGPWGLLAGAAVTAGAAVLTTVGGDAAIDAVDDAINKYNRIGKNAGATNILGSAPSINMYYGGTIRERSVNLAARHGLNARFNLGSEAMLFHK